MGTVSGADANGSGGVATGNKANGGGIVRSIDVAIKRMVLVMLWVLVLAIQRMVVLGLVKLPLYRKQIL